jgi:hypothetical protein
LIRYFVVPSEAPWPREAWGLNLGTRVRNIRAKRAYNKPRYHQQLEGAGFVMDLSTLDEDVKIDAFR